MIHGTAAFQLSLIITRNCNLNCSYCYEHNKNNGIIDVKIAQDAIEKYLSINDYPSIEISLFGGEPFLEFELIKDICEWTWSKNWRKRYHFFIDTNGTLITDEVKNWALLNRDKVCFGLSLDGSEITHNLNRSNSFNMIDLDFFLSTWPDQSIKMTISDKNLGNLASDIIFIQQKGFKIRGCNFAEGIAIDKFDEKILIIAEQLRKLIDFYIDNPHIEIAPILNIPLSLCETCESNGIKKCGSGVSMVVVDIDGKTYPCTYFSPLSMDNKLLEKVSQIDFHDNEAFVNQDCIKNCYLYPICNSCYAGNFVTTGSIFRCSYQKCEITKLRAVAAANYMAHKIIHNNTEKLNNNDYLTIQAIKKIKQLFF